MKYDFDTPVDRRGTSCLKWDYSKRFTGREGLLPLWVADMDFPAPAEVIEALEARVRHGIFGYTIEPESWYQAIAGWMQNRHGWAVERDWMIACPGVVPSIRLALLAFTRPGDRVIIQPPVYYPFRESILLNDRLPAENPLRLDGQRYSMDYEGLERLIDERTRLLILCSPHNPVGRVWTREELARLAEICERRGIIIISDEIHHDLVMAGHRHVPTAAAAPAAAARIVTLTSATKTFNLAGLGGSLAIIPDRDLRGRFRAAMERLWTGVANAMSVAATEAAYRHGASWLEQLLAYVAGNYELTVRLLAERLPRVRVFPLEGTYLAWLDLRPLGLSDAELRDRILGRAGVWLDDGPMFGTGGSGFQRVNLACPRRTLETALERMAGALAASTA